eukprot:s1218_g18.t1
MAGGAPTKLRQFRGLRCSQPGFVYAATSGRRPAGYGNSVHAEPGRLAGLPYSPPNPDGGLAPPSGCWSTALAGCVALCLFQVAGRAMSGGYNTNLDIARTFGSGFALDVSTYGKHVIHQLLPKVLFLMVHRWH